MIPYIISGSCKEVCWESVVLWRGYQIMHVYGRIVHHCILCLDQRYTISVTVIQRWIMGSYGPSDSTSTRIIIVLGQHIIIKHIQSSRFTGPVYRTLHLVRVGRIFKLLETESTKTLMLSLKRVRSLNGEALKPTYCTLLPS